MYRSILHLLCCPRCKTGFTLQADAECDDDVLEGTLTCAQGHPYRISGGVADFSAAEQGFANQWESLGGEQSFADLDRDMDARNPAEIIERREKVLHAIAAAVSDRKCKVVLDIASGRGLLLAKLAEALDDDAHIISVDLSAFVLEYDHQKFRQLAPDRRISYLACDATSLPLRDNAVDAATTYCGFSNMLGCAGEALQEAHRVVKPGAVLADSYVVIQRESRGYEALQHVCLEQRMTGAEDFFLHDGLAKHHEALFSAVKYNAVFEGVGIGNGMDLLPYQGEWYAEQVFVSTK